jgi:hypothetical protein
MIEMTSWPAARTATTTEKSQLSSATRRTGSDRYPAALSTNSSCASESVAKRSVDIVRRQPGICLDQALLVRPFGELADNQFHGNPSTPDNRLAEHHPRVEFNSIMSSHCAIAPVISGPGARWARLERGPAKSTIVRGFPD